MSRGGKRMTSVGLPVQLPVAHLPNCRFVYMCLETVFNN